ncbi:hypothetical protein FKM82_024280 [Ascaphus truei]
MKHRTFNSYDKYCYKARWTVSPIQGLFSAMLNPSQTPLIFCMHGERSHLIHGHIKVFMTWLQKKCIRSHTKQMNGRFQDYSRDSSPARSKTHR